MKTKIKLICMSFDGEYIINSDHDNLEDAIETAQNLGDKWFFYSWCVFVKNKTIVDCGGVYFNMSTNTPILSELFKGRRFTTMQKEFKKVSKNKDLEGADIETFESFLIDNLRK